MTTTETVYRVWHPNHGPDRAWANAGLAMIEALDIRKEYQKHEVIITKDIETGGALVKSSKVAILRPGDW